MSATTGAIALACAVGTVPVRVVLDLTEVRVVKVLQAKAAKLFVAGNLKVFFQIVAPLLVIYELFQNKSAP